MPTSGYCQNLAILYPGMFRLTLLEAQILVDMAGAMAPEHTAVSLQVADECTALHRANSLT